MRDRWILTMILFVAFMGTIGDFTTTAYGDSPEVGDTPSGANSIFGGVVGEAFSNLSSAFSILLPSLTGIWFIDNLIINPLGTYIIYLAALNWKELVPFV